MPSTANRAIAALAATSRRDLLALSRPAVCVPGEELCEAVDLMFRRDGRLTSVAVVGKDGRLGLVTRFALAQAMSGPMGYGRVLYARRPVAQMASWSPLLVAADTGVVELATQIVMRAEDRWDDILVRAPQGLRVAGAAEVLQGLAGAFAIRATHDELTGLPNRSMFSSQIAAACARLQGSDDIVAVLYIDLDDFKLINDTHGHNGGDAALVAAGKRLVSATRAGDVVARLGGDEFAVLLRLSGHPPDTPVQDVAERAAAIGERYRTVLRRPVESGLRASIGVAVCHPRAMDAETLLREADMAMYAAKRAGGDRVVVADRVGGEHLRLAPDGSLEPHPDVVARAALREAMRTGELVLHYQPIVRLRDRAIVSVEALVRWRHPQRGLLAPGDFLPDAERLGLMVDLDAWVLDQAINDYAGWRHHAVPGVPESLNVNISRATLARTDIVELVTTPLRRHALAAQHLRLELVEDAETELLVAAAPRLDALRDLGVSLTWDDMGTGASSLRHVTQLRVDGLKIDRAFVNEMNTSPSALTVIRMLVHLAEGLGISVTAEGVETPEQLATLTEIGAGYAQGYHLGRPAPADQFLELLETMRLAGACAGPLPRPS